jgi:hypothetical protein
MVTHVLPKNVSWMNHVATTGLLADGGCLGIIAFEPIS